MLTTASSYQDQAERVYSTVLQHLGAAQVRVLHITCREEANDQRFVDAIYASTAVFMTGGDQSRLSSILGGSEVGKAMHRGYKRMGMTIAGTSAGAAAISEHMIVGGRAGLHPRKFMLNLAPGLGLLKRVVIDQHFTQRRRLGRLLSVVAQNPFILGVGIDEDTAILVTPDSRLEVLGSEIVTILDGRHLSHTNVVTAKRNEHLAVCNVHLHILPAAYGYHIENRQIVPPAAEQAEAPAPPARPAKSKGKGEVLPLRPPPRSAAVGDDGGEGSRR